MALLAPEVPMPDAAAEVPKAQEPPVSRAVVPLPPPPPAPPVPGSSASSDVLDRALSEVVQLREDLQGTDSLIRLQPGRLELVSGWLHSDASVRAALRQTAAASEEEKQAATQAAAAREAALKDAAAAQDCCKVEAELKDLRDKQAEEARGRRAEEEKMKAREDAVRDRDTELTRLAEEQTTERGRLETLEQKLSAERAELDAKAKALEEVVSGVGPMAEVEARVLSSAALTRVFSHLRLRDPDANLAELLEPVDVERYAAAAEAVKGQVEALLGKFRAFAPAPTAGGAADPAASGGGAGEGNTTTGVEPLANDGVVQG
nr:troponin T, slow skeletal muscle-like [Aegilops tauschii subsp. strangulata]